MINKSKKNGIKLVLITLSLFGAHNSSAQGDPSWNIVLDERAQYVLNANRSSVAEQQIDETQINSAVGVNGEFGTGQRVATEFRYRAGQTKYFGDSQQGNPRVSGAANLTLGAPLDPLEFNLSHERRQVLRDTTAPDVFSNRTDRTTVGGGLILRTSPRKSNRVSVGFQYRQSKFDSLARNNTDRASVDLRYQRRVSPISSIGVNVGSRQVTFENAPDADYDLNVVYGFMSRTLRTAEYFLAFGVSSVKRDSGETSENPYAQLELARSLSASVLRLGVSSTILDNSNAGDSVLPDETGVVVDVSDSISSANLNVSEQFNHTSLYGTFNNQSLCRSCSLGLRGEYYSDQYQNLTIFDEDVLRFSASLTYRMPHRSGMTFTVQRTDREFINQITDNNYSQNQIALTWFKSLGQHFRFSLFTRLEGRDYDGESRSYDSQYFGMSLSYSQN